MTGCNGGGSGKESTSDSTSTASTNGDDKTLLGAGSTFVYPLFSKQFSEYNKLTGLKINYQSIGSGGGILQLTNKTVDFGESDAPLTEEQAQKMGVPVLHIPMCSGAVVISYNLPEVKDTLKLTPDVIADIFLGKITKWNDAKIAAGNTGVKLPATAIVVAHRSDGSGTTNIFTDYLSKVSDEWKTKVGKGTSVNWPSRSWWQREMKVYPVLLNKHPEVLVILNWLMQFKIIWHLQKSRTNPAILLHQILLLPALRVMYNYLLIQKYF